METMLFVQHTNGETTATVSPTAPATPTVTESSVATGAHIANGQPVLRAWLKMVSWRQCLVG